MKAFIWSNLCTRHTANKLTPRGHEHWPDKRLKWDPATAIQWNTEFDLPFEVEEAVVQIMTYLIENETAALLVPSRFVSQVHPHFREVMQVLALEAADEARHFEVFTRRALLKRKELGLSTSGGQASLKTLVEEPDFAIASFLLSVLGEGTFLSQEAGIPRTCATVIKT